MHGAGLPEAVDVVGIGDPHPGGALDERLDHDRGELRGVAFDEGDRLVRPARRRVAGRPQDGEAQRGEELAVEAGVAEREGAERVPVVGVLEGEEARLSGHASVGPVLERDPDRLLDRRGAVAREEEARIVHRDEGRQRLGELDRRHVPVAEHRRVGHALELPAERLVELGDAMAERRDPQRRDGVEVAAPLGVDQLVALGALDHDGPVLCVDRHLREAVPDAGGVAVDPVAHAAEPTARAALRLRRAALRARG